MIELDLVDVMLTLDQNGETRINLGNLADGKGFAAGAAIFASADGFLSLPNGPTGTRCAQALMVTHGLLRYALAVRDTRWDAKAGTLAPGDRAVVSACDAFFLLSQAANTVSLQGAGVAVTVDAQNGNATMSKGQATITVNATSITLDFGGVSRLVVDATGIQITVPPGPASAFTVNGVPVPGP